MTTKITGANVNTLSLGVVNGVIQTTLAAALEKVTISATTAQSAALNADTKFVRVLADANCCIIAADNPTATTSDLPLTAEGAEYFGVIAGQKIAAITR